MSPSPRSTTQGRWVPLALLALAVMPDAFYRFLAFPNGIAMIALGYSLWAVSHTDDTVQPADLATSLSSTGV